ncbi:acyltransferase [Mucilaginibacter terrae]|uniref:acyltransferase n=1 Tax=Mucilaginibacter terrae TaxID=1955052 RepID=UPI0036720F14
MLKKLRNEFLRKVIYRKYQIGSGFYCGIRVRIWARQQVTIGKNFYIGRDSFIESDVIIGDNVIWANRVALVGRYDHHYQQIGVPIRLALQIRDKNYKWLGLNNVTIIEDDVWVGYGTTIMSGVTIKTGSIIAAGSVVTKDVEPFSIYAGVPAKKIKNRFNSIEDLKEHLDLIR